MFSHTQKLIISGILSLFIFGCSNVDYNHPLDIVGNSDAKNMYNKDPGAFGDDNNDGVVNFLDPTNDQYFIRDTTPPVITLIGPDTLRVPIYDTNKVIDQYLDQYNVYDAGIPGMGSDKNVNVNCNISKINTFKASDTTAYPMYYTATDQSGNTATITRYVIIFTPVGKDVDPPIITFSDSIVPINLGSQFVDNGVTAYDYTDGIITDKIVTSGDVNTAKAGDYIITYTVTDAAGNIATKSRTIRVVEDFIPDIENPSITLNPPDTIQLGDGVTISQFMATYVEPGYTAFDKRDGVITEKVIVSQIMQLSSKYWCFNYDVSDNAGNNAATVKRYIKTTVSDLDDPPIIDLAFPDSIIQIVLPNGKWVDPGYSASDLTDGDITSQVVVNDSALLANINTLGTYLVTYTVSNSKGLTSQKIRQVEVVDNPFDIIPPVIEFVGGNPDTVLINSSTSYKDPGFTVTDNKDKTLTKDDVTATGNVNMAKMGKYTISYSVQDAAGNTGRATRTVWVVRDLETSDLLSRYTVPSEDPLPAISQTPAFTKFEIDGEGPDLTKLQSDLKSMTLGWDPTRKSVDAFAFNLNVSPHYMDLKAAKQTFGSQYPELTISDTRWTELNGKYYVVYLADTKEFVWVEQKGKFAIIWKN